MAYFNYTLHSLDADAATYWERRTFVHAWWAIGREDERWVPPLYKSLARELNPRHNSHLARLRAELIHVEALHRTGVRRSRTDQQEIPLVSVLERPLAAAVALIDPRRRGPGLPTAHLGLPQLAYDDEAFDQLYYHLIETLAEEDIHRLIGPVGLSPYLGRGILVDHWDVAPPLHTPTNPPYLPELLERRLHVWRTGRLFHATTDGSEAETDGPATLSPFDPSRLAGDLLPLLVAASAGAPDDGAPGGFAPPDTAEAAFLLRQVGPGAVGGLAAIDGTPVGFVLLAPDTARRRRAARGGRPLWGRVTWALAGGRPVAAGRLLFGAVGPDWRGRGVGRQLWDWALAAARARGWRSLTVGPVWWPRPSPGAAEPAAAAFLVARGAVARQTYRLYERSF